MHTACSFVTWITCSNQHSEFLHAFRERRVTKLKLTTTSKEHVCQSFFCVSQSSIFENFDYFKDNGWWDAYVSFLCFNTSLDRQQAKKNTDTGRLIRNIHESFVIACIPGKKPYVVALSDFISSTAACYKSGIALNIVKASLMNMKETGFRRLKPEEHDLLHTWLTLVYKTLRALHFPTKFEGDLCQPEPVYDQFVTSVVSAIRNGYSLEKIRLEQVVSIPDTKPRTDFEAALLSQSTRIVAQTVEQASKLADS
eukprot:jgi/Galph1/1119/GphlegSOOS_G5876.1